MLTLRILLQILVIVTVVCAVANILVVSPGVQYVFAIESVVSGVPAVSYFIPIFCAILIAAAGVVGWCGSVGEDKLCISLYVTATLLILLGQFYLAFTYYIPSENNFQVIKTKEEIKTAWASYSKDQKVTKNFGQVEENWECCGLLSKVDYNRTDLPFSCCNDVRGCSLTNSYNRGCLEAYSDGLLFWLKASFISIFFSCCTQVLASIVSLVTIFPSLLNICKFNAEEETGEPSTDPLATTATESRPIVSRTRLPLPRQYRRPLFY